MILNSVLPFYPTFRRLTVYMTVCQYSSLICPGHRPPSPLYKWRYNRHSLALQLSRVEALFLFFMELYFVLCIWAALGLPQQFESHSTNKKITGDSRKTTHQTLRTHGEKERTFKLWDILQNILIKKMKSTSYAVLILWQYLRFKCKING